MLVVPSKLVPTVKAPDGKKRPRIVLCGNLIEDTAKRTGFPCGNGVEAVDSKGQKSFEP